jgi:hypothetical protein
MLMGSRKQKGTTILIVPFSKYSDKREDLSTTDPFQYDASLFLHNVLLFLSEKRQIFLFVRP